MRTALFISSLILCYGSIYGNSVIYEELNTIVAVCAFIAVVHFVLDFISFIFLILWEREFFQALNLDIKVKVIVRDFQNFSSSFLLGILGSIIVFFSGNQVIGLVAFGSLLGSEIIQTIVASKYKSYNAQEEE